MSLDYISIRTHNRINATQPFEFLRVSGAVLSLVAGHGEIDAVPTERDMGDVDHRLTNLFFPLQCR